MDSDYHADLDEEAYCYHRCQVAVRNLEIMQFEHADAASEWIFETARQISGCDSGLTMEWLRELLHESGMIPEEVLHARIIQPQEIDTPCPEPQAG